MLAANPRSAEARIAVPLANIPSFRDLGPLPGSTIAGRLARLGLVLTLTAYTTYVFLTAALAFGAVTDATPETAKSLWEIRFVSETFVNFPVALLIGSVALAVRPGLTRPWYRWGSLATAALFLVGGAALAGTDSSRPMEAT